MSVPSSDLDPPPPQPLSRNQVCPPPHPDPTLSPGGERVGAGPNSDDLEKKPSTLSTRYIKLTMSRVFNVNTHD